jgi:MFS family permease
MEVVQSIAGAIADHALRFVKWAWESLLWIAAVIAAISGVFSFLSNLIQITESWTFRFIWDHRSVRWWLATWHNLRRNRRVRKLRRELAEAEAESERRT